MSTMAAAAASDLAAQRESFRLAAEFINLAAAVLATAVLARRRHLYRTPGIGWALAMFGIFAVILFVAMFPVKDDGSFLAHGYTVSQGREMGHDARIVVRIDGETVWVGGRTDTVISGTLQWKPGTTR